MIHIKNYIIAGSMLAFMGIQAVVPVCPEQTVVIVDKSCRLVSKNAVAKHKKEIESQLKRGRYIMMGLKTAVVGFAAYGTYSILSSFINHSEVRPSEQPVALLADNASWQEGRDAFNRAIPIIELLRKKMLEKQSEVVASVNKPQSESWISAFGAQLVNMLGMSLASAICLPYLDKLVFKDDIAWFFSQKTHMGSCLEQLSMHAETLKNGKNLPDYKASFAKQAMQEQLQDLVLQIEKVLAFVDCIVERAIANNLIIPDDLRDTAHYIETITNDFCTQAYDAVTTTKQHELLSLVKQFKKELENRIDAFSYFDARVQEMQASCHL